MREKRHQSGFLEALLVRKRTLSLKTTDMGEGGVKNLSFMDGP